MHTWIARLEVSLRRRSLIGYSLGLALYTFVVVAIYPAFKDSTALDKLTEHDSAAAALFGVTGSLTTPSGWMNANIYANFFPLIMLLLTVGYGAGALAGQDEDGTLCLQATLPVRRSAIALQKIAAMAVQGLALAAAVAIFALVGRSFELTIAPSHVVAVSLAVLIMGLDFGLVTMIAGAVTGRRGTAIGVGSALAGASYLISSLAPVAHWLHPARYASLFYWSVGNNQIEGGVTLTDYIVLLTAGVCAAFAATAAFQRSDLH